ncbi:LPXTG cell wall anchor domain-containing protein [Streptococcus suis]|nr:LPXTG cell wall anchor domain-containing protein [Streptococcus suis]
MAEKYSSVKPVTKVALFSSVILASFVVSQQGALAEEATSNPEGGTVSAVTNANPNPTATATSENSSSSEAVTEEAPASETPASTTEAPKENTLEVDPTTLPKSLVGQEFTNAEEVRLDNIQLDNSKKRHELTEAETSKVKETSSGTIYLEYAGQPASGQNFYNLFSLSSTTQNNEYTNIYINNGVAGIESRLQSNSGNDRVLRLNSGGYRANNGEWNALAVTYNQNENSSLAVNLYLNGELVGTGTASQDIFGNGLDKAQLGETKRGSQNVWAPGSLSVNNFTVYNRALTAEEIAQRSALFIRRDYPLIKEEGSEITEKITVFEGGRSGQKNPENGVASFRIPALLKTDKGTLIAATDQRHDHYSDWGNIAQVVKRSTDQGATWGSTIKIVDLRENPRARDKNQGTPLTIDTALVQDPTTKRIFAIYDMYPEGRALFGAPDTYEAEYTVVEGKHYLNLYKAGETAPYLLKEDGRVYTPTGEETEYRVNIQDTSAAYANIGDIYQGTGTEPIGNIYFQTQKTAPFRTALANFIWMSYSDDDGVTWSHPKDITPNLKKPHMKFLGLGPGTGIVLHTGEHAGRLVVPAYSLSYTGGMNSQSALVFYSDDHGETWHAGKSFNDGRRLANGTVLESSTMNNGSEIGTEATIVQLNNGQIKMFMRGKKGAVRMATSTDGGASWINEVELFQEVPDPYVQLSAIRIVRNGKEYVLLSNANGPGTQRMDGYIRIAEVQADGSLVWIHHQMVQDGEFAYNSIQHLGGDDFGLLYEHKTGDQNWYSLYYKKFNWNYLTQETPGRPQSSVTSVDFYENNYIGLNFENDILALNNPSLRLSNGNVAEFVSQLDSKRLLYRITDADKGAAILDVASGSLTNINKLPVSIATLLTKDGDKYLSKVNGRTVKISGEDVYEDGRGFGLANLMDGNKSTVSELRWETANNPAITLPQTITLRLKNEKDLHSLLITKRTPGNGTMTKYQVKAYLGDQQVFDTGEKSVAFATADIPVLFNGVRADKIEFIPIEAHTNPTTKNNTMWTVRELQLFELLPTPVETYTEDVELKDQATNLRVQLEAGESKAIVGLRVTHKESGTADTPETLLGQDYDLYDISLVDDKGQAVAPTRETLVIVPIDEGKEVEKVLYLSGQGPSEVDFTETTASDETGKNFKSVVFVASTFSEYAIVYREVKAHGEGVKAPVLPEGETPVVEPEKVEEPEIITSKGESVKADALPSFDIEAWLKENAQSETEPELITAKGESTKAEALPNFDIEAWLKENAQSETEPELITAKGESTKAEALPNFDIDAWLKENAQSETEPELITAKGESTKADALPSFDIETWLKENAQSETEPELVTAKGESTKAEALPSFDIDAWLKENAPKDKGADAKSNNAKGETSKKLPDTGASSGIGLSILGLLSLVGLGASKGRRQRRE